MTKLRAFLVLATALLLLSCSSNPQQADHEVDQEDARGELFSVRDLFSEQDSGRAALALPPDLLASANDKVRANSSARGELRVLPEVIGATIQSDQNQSWLEIDAEVEVVWRKLSEFWAFQGVDLSNYQPQAGLMETDWFANRETKPSGGGIVAGLVQNFIARRTALDKFAFRLQRDPPNGTKLFVTHRRQEKIAKQANSNRPITEYNWVERESDAEKIAQLLQTIVLLFGAGGSDADESESAVGDQEPA